MGAAGFCGRKMKPSGMKLSVLMPVYNERATLGEILSRVQAVPIDKEIVVVDNCSTDGTRELLQTMLDRGEAIPAKREPDAGGIDADGSDVVRVVLQERNKGKGSSVRCALAAARGEWVIVQDADLEYDPRDYHKLLARAYRWEAAAGHRGRHVAVFGTRLSRGSDSRRRQAHDAFLAGRIGLSIAFRVLYATSLSDVATCYKLMRRSVAQNLDLRANGFDFDFEIAAKLRRSGVAIVEVPISYDPRGHGDGKKIRALQDGSRALWTLLKYRCIR
jgi:glycosyltransferase involved in cell wall biosynthesis